MTAFHTLDSTRNRQYGLRTALQSSAPTLSQVVRSAANGMACSELSAATTLANKAGGGMAAIYYLAAVVEMTEPSNTGIQAAPKPTKRAGL